MHKTGTKALQFLLAAEREALLKLGIFYPDDGCQHHNFILNLRRADWTPEPLLRQLALARHRSASTIIFSAEVLSLLSDDQIGELAYHLGDNEIVFIFVFRHWCDFLPSRWAQNCRVRDSQTFSEYMTNLSGNKNRHVDFSYDLTLNKFRINTEAQIKAISYSNAIVLNRSVLAEIFSAMEFASDLSDSLLSKERPVNVRASWVETEQVRLLNDALSDHLSLNKNDLFQSFAEYRAVRVAYRLQLNNFDPNVLDILTQAIKANEKLVHLSSTDCSIDNLNRHFQSTSAQYFINLHENFIFYGDYQGTVRCTDLHSSDIQNPGLKEAVRDFTLSDFS